MKIDSNDVYKSIPNGTKLKLTITGMNWTSIYSFGTSFIAKKDNNDLIACDHNSHYWSKCWHWSERDEKGFEFFVETIEDENIEANKHLKGYMFDSLVFRYQVALERGLPLRVEEYIGNGLSKPEARNKAQMRNNDDLMRFIRVLDEAIGEHN